MKQILTLLLMTACIFACTGNTDDESAEQTQTEEKQTSSPAKVESMPQKRLVNLRMQCDYIDIIFYTLPLSMSQNNPGDVQHMLSFIDRPIPRESLTCKSMGRVSYMSKGEIIEEAELYFDEGCAAFAFLEDGKQKYFHAMNPKGIQFLGNMIRNAQNVQRSQ